MDGLRYKTLKNFSYNLNYHNGILCTEYSLLYILLQNNVIILSLEDRDFSYWSYTINKLWLMQTKNKFKLTVQQDDHKIKINKYTLSPDHSHPI